MGSRAPEPPQPLAAGLGSREAPLHRTGGGAWLGLGRVNASMGRWIGGSEGWPSDRRTMAHEQNKYLPRPAHPMLGFASDRVNSKEEG